MATRQFYRLQRFLHCWKRYVAPHRLSELMQKLQQRIESLHVETKSDHENALLAKCRTETFFVPVYVPDQRKWFTFS